MAGHIASAFLFVGVADEADEAGVDYTPMVAANVIGAIAHGASLLTGASWAGHCEDVRAEYAESLQQERLQAYYAARAEPVEESTVSPSIPNSEVGKTTAHQKEDPATGIKVVTFSYTAAPGLLLNIRSQLVDNTLKGESLFAIQLDSEGHPKLTEAPAAVLVVNGIELPVIMLEARVTQNDGITRELLSGAVPASTLEQLRGAVSLEVRFGKWQYALPSVSLGRLDKFATYLVSRIPEPAQPVAPVKAECSEPGCAE